MARRQVDQVHVRQRVEVVFAIRSSCHGDGRAVHVDLAIADAIVPRPCERCHTIRKVLWDGERKGMRRAIAV